MKSYSRPNSALALIAGLAAASPGISNAALAGLIPGHVNNYSECVIRQLQPATGTLEIEAIVGECRSDFPDASRRTLLDPRSVQSCYRRHEDRIGHRPAAEALFGACQDYFRRQS